MLLFVNKPEMYVLMGYGFQEMSSKLCNYQNRKCGCFTPEKALTGICDACMHCLHPPHMRKENVESGIKDHQSLLALPVGHSYLVIIC